MPKLLKNHSPAHVVVSIGEEATNGIWQFLRENNTDKEIKFIGFDFNTIIRNAIFNHEIDATIAQNPFLMGYLGVKSAYQPTQNVEVPKRIFTDIKLVNTQNIHSDEIQAIINQDINRIKP